MSEKESDNPPLNLQKISDGMVFVPSERYTVSCGTVCVDPKASRVLILYNRRLGIWQLPKGRKNIDEDLHDAALRETYEETGVHAILLPLKVRTRSTRPHSPATSSTSGGSETCDAVVPIAAVWPQDEHGREQNGKSGCESKRVTEREQGQEQEQHSASTKDHRGGTEEDASYPQRSSRGGATDDPKVACDLINNEYIGIVQYPDLQAATPNTVKTVFFFAAWADSTAPMGPGAQEEHEDLHAEWVDFSVADQRLRFEPEKQAMWKVKRDMAQTGIAC